MHNINVSFVIPTRNRSEFIEPLISRCLEIENSIVIISDNSDEMVINNIVDGFNTDRIIYNYYSEKLSVIDNFNFSLKYVKTKYVCYLGDDDIIGPGFEDALKIMNDNEIDVLNVETINRPLQYFWPNNPSKNWGDLGGKLFFNSFTGGINKVNIKKELNIVKSKFGLGPLALPRLYLGIVNMSLINRILDKHKRIFGGYSPDIYSSYFLSIECTNPYTIDYPIIIPGACSKSTSSARANRTDIGDLFNNDHLGRFQNVVWDKRIPAFYSPFNVWGSTLLIASENNNDRISFLNFAHLYALNLINSNFSIFKLGIAIKSLSKNSFFNKLVIILFIGLQISKLICLKIKQMLKYFIHKRPGGVKYEINDNHTSYDAFMSMKNFLNNKGVYINKKF
jgi:glycosyltransferase involved in cell wall biosynthesis